MATATQRRPSLIQRVEASFRERDPMLHVPSSDNLAALGTEPDNSAHAGVKDVTKPGLPMTRTKPMRLTEQLGGFPLIWNNILNRGTNFTLTERQNRGMEGLLPPVHETIEHQAQRVMNQLHEDCPTPLSKYELLSQLAATNNRLLYYVLIHNLEELAPIVYTPTVGEACQKFDRIYRNALGMYFDAFNQRGRFRRILNNWPSHNVQIIVVSDGGRILGLGDLGTNGMGIPIGKIELYVAGGGFHPEHSMPCILDMGTNREVLLNDPFYLGNKKQRLEGDEHLAVVEEFCLAVKDKWPNCLVQFEDFQTDRAFAILDHLRDKLLCFNDDIQGTGAIVTTGFINGMKAQGTPLEDARIVFFGAGSSAVGVALTIASLLVKECGVTKEEALKALYMVDTKGLVTMTRGDKLAEHKLAVARKDDIPNMKDLKEIVAYVKPHALIGLSGFGPAFDQETIEELCKYHDSPLIFPLSNPTSRSEITAQDAYTWSKGKCLFAAGSPFDPVQYDGKTFYPAQANNVFIFPGVGFGAVMVKAKTVTDSMFLAAARAVADSVTPEMFAKGRIYPVISDLRRISALVAAAVAEEAFQVGVAGIPKPADMLKYIEDRMWEPTKDELDPSTMKTLQS